ncbi:helix-turn-helix domain-containing protein [Natrialba chahannaoensis]|nr:ArsR family transcriptional regulator [Natrialba chahannaoensis]
MSVQTHDPPVVNELYQPTEKDEQVLEALKDGRDSDEPWGRANPRWLMDQTGLSKSNVEFCLRSLHDAGWVRRPSRGLYELVEDPRGEDDE